MRLLTKLAAIVEDFTRSKGEARASSILLAVAEGLADAAFIETEFPSLLCYFTKEATF